MSNGDTNISLPYFLREENNYRHILRQRIFRFIVRYYDILIDSNLCNIEKVFILETLNYEGRDLYNMM